MEADIPARPVLDWQVQSALLRLNRQIPERLGDHALQRLAESGMDVLLHSRSRFQKLTRQLYPVRDETSSWRWKQGAHRNIERPSYVEDGYVYLYFPESAIFQRFLEQEAVRKMVLERLVDLFSDYLEKVYYRLERYWSEFLRHCQKPDTVADNGEREEIAQRHREKIKGLESRFWQDRLEEALEQLRLDFPEEPDISARHNLGEPVGQLSFEIYRIPLGKEIKHRCNWPLYRNLFLEKLGEVLERSLETGGLALQKADSEANGYRYLEYPDAPQAGGAGLPDEAAGLVLQYATAGSLSQEQTLREAQLVDLSEKIRCFVQKVERSMGWFGRGGFGVRRTEEPGRELAQLFADAKHWTGEARLLLELLEKADWALRRRSCCKRCELRAQLKQLLRDLFALSHKPFFEKDLGVQLSACYRTTSKRKESYLRLKRVLEDFVSEL